MKVRDNIATRFTRFAIQDVETVFKMQASVSSFIIENERFANVKRSQAKL